MTALLESGRCRGPPSGLNDLHHGPFDGCFFLQLMLRKRGVRIAAWVAIVEGVLTRWLQGYLLLMGVIA
ncbi:AmiS/UreI family transporter [Polaromonas sp. OV174]|uniref:AmiS/UreI family transporter n=1 Tax=Polaromonas sp. OV174 TaxID=1855300 RepID=UPI000B82C014|nr:AmiS/UreI family transporter [Polaromonas sp. OV174]